MKAVVVGQDLVTAWGRGPGACWDGLLTGHPAFSPVTRFDTQAFPVHLAATVAGLESCDGSLVMQMLAPLLAPLAGTLPADTLVVLATTTGEVDLLERALLAPGGIGAPGADESRLDVLLGRVMELVGLPNQLASSLNVGGAVPCRDRPSQEHEMNRRRTECASHIEGRPASQSAGQIISCACASSSAAIGHAAGLIAAGARDSVLVVACDAVTEFVYAGFASLMALDPDGARPFDKDRKGLTVGEGAGYVWLMSEERARREDRLSLGQVAGWGLTSDANHMTGPSRDGDGLARAIAQALTRAGEHPEDIGSISAHGTGTSYNDSMEMKAFKRVFGATPVPTYSVKGSVGHTMGATGLVQMLMALKSLGAQTVPPSAHLNEPDPEAAGWVSNAATAVSGMRTVLSVNSGFGGVNAAVVIKL